MRAFCTRRCFTYEARVDLLNALYALPNVYDIDVGYVDDYTNDLHYYLITWYED